MPPHHERFLNQEEEDDSAIHETNLENNGLSPEVNTIIADTLKYIGRGTYYHLFKDNVETLPLIANMVNYLAKNTSYAEEFYQYKKILVAEIIKEHPRTWESGGVQYSETLLGQVSFHVFEDVPYMANTLQLGIDPENRVFSGENLQEKALSLIDTYIIEEAREKGTSPKI